MNFINPSFLFALFAVSIPIIIHLFYFRRFKTIYFSDIRFLKSVKQDKQSKNNLKHLIILLLRIFTIASLVFAFSRPFIPVKENNRLNRSKSINILIDNSMSMESEGTEEKLIETAKRIGKEIVENYGSNIEFRILTNDQTLKQQQFLNKEQATEAIDLIEVTQKTANINQSINWLEKKQDDPYSDFYIISDFQKSSFNKELLSEDTLNNYFLIPQTAVENSNVYIDSVWLSAPVINYGENLSLNVRINNHSDKEIKSGTLKLYINGRQKAISTYNLSENSSTKSEINFTISEKGWNKCKLQIEDYPITFDDIYYFSFLVKERYDILSVANSSENKYLSKVFSTETYFNFQTVNIKNINQNELQNYDVVILDEIEEVSASLISSLSDFVRDGGNLVIIPPAISRVEDINSILQKFQINKFIEQKKGKFQVKNINTESYIFQGILEEDQGNKNLRTVKANKIWWRNRGISDELSLLKWDNGQDLLSYQAFEKGNIFIFNVPLSEDWSNFTSEWLFTPIMFKISLLQKQHGDLSYQIGKDLTYNIIRNNKNLDNAVEVSYLDKKFIPQQRNTNGRTRIFLDNNFDQAGFYQINEKPGDIIAMNLSRKESELNFISKEELKEISGKDNIYLLDVNPGELKSEINKLKNGIELWKYFIVLALIFIIIEILLLRLWKV
jgi:hypothetical protein